MSHFFEKRDVSIPFEIFSFGEREGLSVNFTPWGATLLQVYWKMKPLTLSYPKMESYLKNPDYFGATVGRYANRISQSQFEIDQTTYHLKANEKNHCLHGGPMGFDKVLWKVDQVIKDEGRVGLTLSYFSVDGENGFPGNVISSVSYIIVNGRNLEISYNATTDQDTFLNLTNHAYWNLDGMKDTSAHQLTVSSDHIVEVDHELIPTGRQFLVEGTFWDLRKRRVMDDVYSESPKGIDHFYLIPGQGLRKMASLQSLCSSLIMDVYSDASGVQVYTGAHLPSKFGGICLETGYSAFHPSFVGQTIKMVKKDSPYRQTSLFCFTD